MKLGIANLMLKFINKLCNRNSGLVLRKYSKLSGEIIYKLEWSECNDAERIATKKLKPCPFCGSKDINTKFTTSTYIGEFTIVCCTCRTTQSREIRLENADFENLTDSMNKAIETWNTRFKADNKDTSSIINAEVSG